jgi:hypothetical protein
VKAALLAAYVAMGAANSLIQAAWQHPQGSNSWAVGVNEATKRIKEAEPHVVEALQRLFAFLQPESGATG